MMQVETPPVAPALLKSALKVKTIMGQRTLKISPSILTIDFGHLAESVRAAEAGGADAIHLDVMDGVFAPNITFGPLVVRAVHAAVSLPLDVHLMVADPDPYLGEFVAAGAQNITVHVEACRHLHRTIQTIVGLGCGAGVALNPSTSIEAVREILPFVDLILVMSVNPGFGGQKFIETTTSKLRRMRRLQEELNPTCDLQVDGGIYPHNIDDVVRAGVNNIVAGSAVFNNKATPGENIAALRQALASQGLTDALS
jgi:ribulose-phosphate 3-epimerase